MGRTRALRNVKEVELEDIPKLTKCGLVTAFKCVESVKMENVSKLGDLKALKEGVERRKEEEEEEQRRKREEEERKRTEAEEAAKKTAVISCKRDWDCVDKHVSVIKVISWYCNEEGLKELDLSGLVNLRELKVGDGCFENVNEVKLIGLGELESVEIGKNSFTKYRDTWNFTLDPNRHFYLKNCPKLKSLDIGDCSFNDYTVCKIENVDALEVIEIGRVGQCTSYNFKYASLELKSILIHSE